MIDTIPDMETRVEESLERVFRVAFPGVTIQTASNPGERSGTCIGIKAESGAEDPIGTNMFPVAIEIEARNLSPAQSMLLREMIGNSRDAKETLSAYSSKQFAMPRGQAVEMIGAPRSVEDASDRIVTYNLTATIQPI